MLGVFIHNQSFAKSKTLLNQDLKKKFGPLSFIHHHGIQQLQHILVMMAIMPL